MTEARTRRVGRVAAAALVGILLVAALVRIWGLEFCLPSTVCRPDESFNAGVAASIARGDLNPHFFNYPTLYFYALGAADAVLLSFDGIRIRVDQAADLSPLLLAGRWFSVLCGCLTVLATFFLGRRLGGAGIGLFASALLAATYMHVRDSHFMSVDVAAGLMVTLALVLVLRAMDRRTVGAFVAAGIVAGLAASTKYTVAIVGISLVIAHALAGDGRGRIGRMTDRRLWLALLAMAFGFLLASPFVGFDFGTFFDHFTYELEHFREGFYPGERDSGTVYYYLARILPYGFGFLPFALSVLGLATWIRRRDRRGFVLLAYIVGYGISVCGGTTVFARYLIPVVPALAVAAAAGAERVLALLPRKRRVAAAVLTAVTLAQPLWYTIRFDSLIATEDTRRQAARWISERLEPGRILLIGGFDAHHWVFGPGDLPGFQILKQRFDTQDRLVGLPVSELTRRGVRYAVTHEHSLLYSTLRPGVTGWLEERAERLVCFEPFEDEGANRAVYDYEDAFYLPFSGFGGVRRPGPAICIYEFGAGRSSTEK